MTHHHVILGAGGIGGYLGALLAAAGERVTVIVRAQNVAAYPPAITLEWTGHTTITAPVTAVPTLAPSTAPDVLWIATKALQLEEALQRVAGTHPRAVVPLLNGVDHVALLALAFGATPVVPATIAVQAERTAPGRIRVTTPFATISAAARGRDRIDHAFTIFRAAGATCDYIPDDATLLWRKLTFLAPFALTTTAANESVGFIRDDPEWRIRFLGAAEETVAAGCAEGAAVDVAPVVTMLGNVPSGMKSSMWRDVDEGNPPELDAIAGVVVLAAERHGINVPVTRDLIARVRARIEA